MPRSMVVSRPVSPPPEEAPPPARGFRFTQLGPIVNDDPPSAAALLRVQLAKAGGNISRAARNMDVTYKTVSRWIAKLAGQGHDPRAPLPS